MRQFLLAIILLTAFSCDDVLLGEQADLVSIEDNVDTPDPTNDGWEVSSLALENVNETPIHNIVRKIHAEPRNLHSFLIVRNNKLVLDAYFSGWHKDRIHDMRSASKSVNSIIIGIAIDNSFIAGVNQRMFDFFPEYQHLNNDSKNEIRIEHLLTMTAGLDWDQSGNPNQVNDETEMEQSKDWLGFVLSKEMKHSPGKNFEYDSGCSNLLAGIIKKSTGDDAAIFAEKRLFQPLSISKYFWRKHDDGLCNAGAGLLLRPRDMAKMGQLFLDSGVWKGNQVVSREWIKAAATPFMGKDNDYGYQWWITEVMIGEQSVRVVVAAGNGGQYIFIVPDFDLVVVFTGGNYAPLNQNQPHALLKNVILPAMR